MDYLAYSGEQDIPTGPYSYLQSSLKVDCFTLCPFQDKRKALYQGKNPFAKDNP